MNTLSITSAILVNASLNASLRFARCAESSVKSSVAASLRSGLNPYMDLNQSELGISSLVPPSNTNLAYDFSTPLISHDTPRQQNAVFRLLVNDPLSCL